MLESKDQLQKAVNKGTSVCYDNREGCSVQLQELQWVFVFSARWNRVKKAERKEYLKNAYRVLLTRARQGMIIVAPEGSAEDGTRRPEYYDRTFEYLAGIGFEVV